MTPPLTALSIVPENLDRLRARVSIERPLHWNEARLLLVALEAAWAELGWINRTAERPSPPAPHGATRS